MGISDYVLPVSRFMQPGLSRATGLSPENCLEYKAWSRYLPQAQIYKVIKVLHGHALLACSFRLQDNMLSKF